MIDVYHEIREKMHTICKDENLLHKPVRVRTRVLTPEEAIGKPEANDFPLHVMSWDRFRAKST